LQRAEKIKAFVEKSNGVSGPIVASAEPNTSSISDLRLTPIGIDHFSKRMSPDFFVERNLIVVRIQKSNFMF
jgi:hypothetical protein